VLFEVIVISRQHIPATHKHCAAWLPMVCVYIWESMGKMQLR